MENLSLNYKIIFCVILAIIFPQQINGEICTLSNEDEMAIKVYGLETKMQKFEKMLSNLDNSTSHYRHDVIDVQDKNEDIWKRVHSSDELLQDLNNKGLHQQAQIEEIKEQLQHLDVHDLINQLQYLQNWIAGMRRELKHLSSRTEPFLSKLYGYNCYWGAHYLYLGKKTYTKDGYTCQRWDSQYPHGHGNNFNRLFLDESVSAAENYCRDPTATGYLWCYTTNSDTRWDRCDIPKCAY